MAPPGIHVTLRKRHPPNRDNLYVRILNSECQAAVGSYLIIINLNISYQVLK